MKTLNELRDYILSNVQDAINHQKLNQEGINDLDVEQVKELMEDYDCHAPEVIYYADGWEVVAGSSFNDYSDYDKGLVDFSNCEGALECVMQEANAIVSEAYYGELESVIEEYLSSIQD